MAQTNKVITNAAGNEITYYGCATVSDACELGGLTPNIDQADRLIVLDDVLDKHTYNVQLSNDPKIEYSDPNQIVAYDDLVTYDGTFCALTSPSTQKLGVMCLSDSMAAEALSISGQGSGYLQKTDMLVRTWGTINRTKTKQLPGTIRIYISSLLGNYLNQGSRLGYEILLQNFITNLAVPSSLSIKRMTCYDRIDNTTAESDQYSTSVDASVFGVTDTTQKRIVVDNLAQIVCGMIKQSASDSKYSQYSDFDTQTAQTLSLMLLSVNNSTNPVYSDLCLAAIDLELSYIGTTDSGTQETMRTNISFEIWHEDTVLRQEAEFVEIDNNTTPEVDNDSDGQTYTIDPSRCILYTTSDNTALSGTIVQAQSFAGQTLEHAGYGKLSTGETVGWFQYVQTPTFVGDGGKNNLFANNKNKLVTVTLPEGVQTINAFAFHNCGNLVSCSFPSTLKKIGEQAFFQSGLTKAVFPRIVDITGYEDKGIELDSQAFSCCKSLTQVIADRFTLKTDTSYQFSSCFNLVNADIKSIVLTGSWTSTDDYIQCGYGCFKDCTSLVTDLSLAVSANADRWVLPGRMFYGCSSLKTIKRAKQTFIELAWDPVSVIFPKTRSKEVYTHCSSLTDIYIQFYDSSSYSDMGFTSSTFEGCVNVQNIYCNCKHPPFLGAKNIWKAGAINPKTCHLYVPVGRTAAYNSKAQWGDFPLSNIHELTDSQFEEVYNSL